MYMELEIICIRYNFNIVLYREEGKWECGQEVSILYNIKFPRFVFDLVIAFTFFLSLLEKSNTLVYYYTNDGNKMFSDVKN